MALDAATLALVANELNSTLLDAKIDKIFEPTRDEVLMTLRTRTQTFKLLLSARSGSARVCLTKESFENPLTPPGFCMLLRKHLTGGRLTGLHMEPGDRIVFFDFLCTNEMGDLGNQYPGCRADGPLLQPGADPERQDHRCPQARGF